nr:sec1 family domain-containing protein 2-like [Cherax quadricarinatus]
MQAANAIHVSEAWWIEACKKVKNAVVFLDNNTAECLHWSGGLTRLVNAGAKNVKEFSSFESGNKDDIKAVFMVSTALRDTTTIVLQDIIKASRFQYCIIITCAHPSVHAYARYGGREVDESLLMSELEQDILSWMGNMTASNKVSLVLIDRTLDLVVASSHRAEPLMGRILSLLPRLYDHQLDSAVSMAPLCKVHPSSEWTLVPGCLAPQGKEIRASAVLNSLVMSSGKEALSLINKYQGLGVVETLCDPRYVHLDQLLSLEKRLLQSIGDPEETLPFTQIFQLLKTRGTHGVTLDDILTLMVYVASLGGPDVFTHKDEYALTNRLSHAIVEDKKLLSDVLLQLDLIVHPTVGQEVDEVSALRSAQCIAEQLHAIASARDHLKNYKHLHIPGDSAQPASYQSLLQKLVYDCLTAPQAEITDLEYKSAGFKDLIKTGFR